MKRLFVCFLTTIMVCSFAMGVDAVQQTNGTSYYFVNKNIEVIFDADSAFDDEQQQRIAEILANDTVPVEGRSWCWLLGHEYISDAVSVITHGVRDTNPRCIRQFYEVTTCANCNYYSEELLSTVYVDCCPAE